jgi:hypothetical protein
MKGEGPGGRVGLPDGTGTRLQRGLIPPLSHRGAEVGMRVCFVFTAQPGRCSQVI